MNLREEIEKGSKRAVARLISMVEREDEESTAILAETWKFSDKSVVIGITGPPGAGKSTLTDQLAKYLLKQGKKVGIIAVDPSSPISGGALLGDRIRMSDLNMEPNVFIRSMATRGALGGLSRAVHGAVRTLEMARFDYIFIETVGVGQSEVDIMGIADVVALVMVPGLGDDIQAGKAGIMEIADVVLVNKSDNPMADRTVEQIHTMLMLYDPVEFPDKWAVEIVKTIASTGEGIGDAFEAIDKYYQHISQSGKIVELHRKRLESELMSRMHDRFEAKFREFNQKTGAVDKCIGRILSSQGNPYSEVERLTEDFDRYMNKEEEKI